MKKLECVHIPKGSSLSAGSHFPLKLLPEWLKRNRAATEVATQEETDRKATNYVVTGMKH